MGWGSKKEKGEKDGDVESKKWGLFKRGNKEASSDRANPYAGQQPPNDPYTQSTANPYAAQNGASASLAPKSQSSLTQPPTSSLGSLTLNSEQGAPPGYARSSPAPNRYEKSPVPQGGYGGASPGLQSQGSYGAGAPKYQSQGSYGQAGGYGSEPYGNGQSSRSGGYGSLGRTNSQETTTTEAKRSELLGAAAARAKQQQPESAVAQQPSDPSYANAGGLDSAEMPGGHGAGADEELTAEEQEEQEVQTAKAEIRYIKQQDVASTRNARRIAEEAQATAAKTLETLNAQGDRIHNTERNLDQATIQNSKATGNIKEIKHLTRSLWVPGKPTSSKAMEKQIDDAARSRQLDRERQEATRQHAYDDKHRQETQKRDNRGNNIPSSNKASLAQRARFQFEDDADDDRMEDEIEENLEVIKSGVKALRGLGQAMGQEIDSQNKHIERIATKTDKVDDEIARNRARMDRIR